MSDKPEWMAVVVARLAEHGNASRACKEAGISRSRAYEAREADREFNRDWLEAIEAYADELEAEADRRGRDGTTTPKWHRVGTDDDGRPVYERHDVRTYSDMLLLARLKALRPERYRENFDLKKLIADAAIEAQQRRIPH